jgi:hypothetical protein
MPAWGWNTKMTRNKSGNLLNGNILYNRDIGNHYSGTLSAHPEAIPVLHNGVFTWASDDADSNKEREIRLLFRIWCKCARELNQKVKGGRMSYVSPDGAKLPHM